MCDSCDPDPLFTQFAQQRMTDPFNPCPCPCPRPGHNPKPFCSRILRKMSRIFAWKIRIIRGKLQLFIAKGLSTLCTDHWVSRRNSIWGWLLFCFKFYTFSMKIFGKISGKCCPNWFSWQPSTLFAPATVLYNKEREFYSCPSIVILKLRT